MKEKKKIIRNETELIIADRMTGEIMSSQKTTTHAVEKEPDFIKLYLQDVGVLMGLSPSDQKVFISLAKHMSYNNLVVLIKPIKEQMCKELNLSLNTINKTIDNLKNAQLLLKFQDEEGNEKRSCWRVNPYLAAKGTWNDIRAIRLQLDYSSEGRKVRVITNPNKTQTVIEVREEPTQSDESIEQSSIE